MFDLAEGTPLGSTAIAMTVAGAVAGLLALIAADPQWWLGALFVALGTAAGVLTVPLVRVFIGEERPFTSDLYVIVPVMAGAGALLSPLMIPLARWCLRMKTPEWKQPIADTPL
jgi:cell shape-determining protein MreD